MKGRRMRHRYTIREYLPEETRQLDTVPDVVVGPVEDKWGVLYEEGGLGPYRNRGTAINAACRLAMDLASISVEPIELEIRGNSGS
jgi:hypothetical protein